MKRIISAVFVMCVSVMLAADKQAETAKDAWAQLVGPKLVKRKAFEHVENNPDLPNVLIYGDSISMDYTSTVKEALKGKANVYRIYCNGGDSGSFIKKIEEMNKVMRDKKLEGAWNFKWDVIHFNVGLHDLKYFINGKLDIKKGKQVASTETYSKNLKGIIDYLKKSEPKAKLIWCTTTPVPEKSNGRKAGDAKRYNDTAAEVLKDYPDVAVNDLYSFTKPNMTEWIVRPGNVHFKKDASAAQGKEVARVILRELKQK